MLSRFQGFVVIESRIGADSVPQRPDPLPVDIVVLHGVAGDEMNMTIRSFKESQPQAKVFVVLSSVEMGRLPGLLATGICGCALASTITAEALAAGLWAAVCADAVVLNSSVWSHLCQLLVGSIGAAACPASIRLSQRQEEVLTSLARGLTERQIASVLGVSEKTVQSHVARMRERLGASSTFQLGVLLGRGGLV
ncbi:MAG: LuxR C-terminal-related transcriptional regulator [Chloroflexota bacterium]|nr:LuxR C-terminal-related transcriptional regulator [Chloroflexota bacterium]